jgi:NTP pyrophosphatase (non-canonical NTP hydrolase)
MELKHTANYYQYKASRTIAAKSDVDMLRHGVFGLAAESGEVAGILQKTYQGHELDKKHLIRELGDVLWMVAEICTALNVSMETVMDINIQKLQARYPYGFEPEKSLNRKEGDI